MSVDELQKPLSPLTFRQILRADCVKRWQVVAVSRQQSVAEHSFNVMTIAREIFKEFVKHADVKMSAPVMSYWVAGIMEAAYLHDLAEVETGDIHTNAKRMLGIGGLVSRVEKGLLKGHGMVPVEDSEFPIDRVIKAADLMDAMRFLWMWGIGSRAREICNEISEILDALISGTESVALQKSFNEVLAAVRKEF